jgi:cell division protein FtsB
MGNFFSDLTGVSSISKQIDRLNTNLEKFSKDSEIYKQEISRLNNNLDKIKREDIEYFKQSTKALKIILMIMAALLLTLIIVLLVK